LVPHGTQGVVFRGPPEITWQLMKPRRETDRRALAMRLAQCPLFAALDPIALEELAKVAVPRTLAAGQLIWQQGEASDSLAVVLAGRLDVSRISFDGNRVLLRVLRTGDLVGLSVIAGEPQSADLVAGETTRIAVVRGRELRVLFARRPEMALRALAHLGQLLGRLTDELEELRFQDLDARLLRCLARHARGRREIFFTHQELADQVGAARPNVSRALKRFERRGMIRCGRGRIEILNQWRNPCDE
jgi:CRP-like cAMP-binding protein